MANGSPVLEGITGSDPRSLPAKTILLLVPHQHRETHRAHSAKTLDVLIQRWVPTGAWLHGWIAPIWYFMGVALLPGTDWWRTRPGHVLDVPRKTLKELWLGYFPGLVSALGCCWCLPCADPSSEFSNWSPLVNVLLPLLSLGVR